MRVLVVDDAPAYRVLVRDALEAAGATVDEAPDGPTALARLRDLASEGAQVLLLTDYRMDGMDGLELVQAARGLYGRAAIMTSHGGLLDRPRSHDVPVMAKPASPAALQRWVEGLLGAIRPSP